MKLRNPSVYSNFKEWTAGFRVCMLVQPSLASPRLLFRPPDSQLESPLLHSSISLGGRLFALVSEQQAVTCLSTQ